MMHSKKTAAWTSAGLVAAVVAAAGIWFGLLSPKSSEISLTASATSLAVGQKEMVIGAVTPAAAGRVVVLEREGDSSWSEVDRSATDAVGKYQFTLPLTARGASSLRTRVLDAGRQSEAISDAVVVTALDPTQVEAQVGKFARADRALRIPGRVTPAGSRNVVIETSPDGQTWTQAATASSSSADGKFAAKVTGLKPGPVQLRVRVVASDTAAEAVGKPATVSVEDYASAGKRYLEIVKPVNDLLFQLRDMSDYLAYTAYQPLYAKLSKALTAQAAAFRQYAYWPQEVKANIVLIEKNNDLRADAYNLLATAKSQSSYDAVDFPGDDPKGSDNAPVLIRAALGLPKRE